MELSNRAYAKHRSVTENAVRKAIKSGRITQSANGKIDPVMADRQWDAHSDPARSKSKKPSKPAVDHTESTKLTPTYQKSRTVHETYKAQLTKLQYEKESGKLIDAEQVRQSAFNAGRITRDRLLALPKKIAPLVMGKTDLKEIEAMMKTHLLEALNELSNRYGSRK